MVFSVLLFGMMKKIPTGFVPQEDGGGVMGVVSLTPGSSLERTDSVVQQVVKIAEKIEGVSHVTDITGVYMLKGM